MFPLEQSIAWAGRTGIGARRLRPVWRGQSRATGQDGVRPGDDFASVWRQGGLQGRPSSRGWRVSRIGACRLGRRGLLSRPIALGRQTKLSVGEGRQPPQEGRKQAGARVSGRIGASAGPGTPGFPGTPFGGASVWRRMPVRGGGIRLPRRTDGALGARFALDSSCRVTARPISDPRRLGRAGWELTIRTALEPGIRGQPKSAANIAGQGADRGRGPGYQSARHGRRSDPRRAPRNAPEAPCLTRP